jgi:hypothetical protein
MGLFKKRSVPTADVDRLFPQTTRIKSPVPALHVDVSKRYDIYCNVPGEERVYQNVRLLAVRTIEDITEYTSMFGGFLEVEAADGTQVMIPRNNIQTLCEHGTQPGYKVVRRWDTFGDTFSAGIGL